MLLVLASAGFYLAKQVLDDPTRLPVDLPTIAKHLEFELENVRYGHTRSGIKKWDLSTRKARRVKGQPEIQLEGVKARIYAEGKLKSDTQIEAQRGSYVVESGDMKLEGEVKITNPQFEIMTRSLSYQVSSGEVTAPDSLVVESEKLKIEAARATIDIERQQLHFRGRVRAHIRLVTAPPGATTARGVEKVREKIKPQASAVVKSKEPSPKPVIESVPRKKAKSVLKKIYNKSKPVVEIEKGAD